MRAQGASSSPDTNPIDENFFLHICEASSLRYSHSLCRYLGFSSANVRNYSHPSWRRCHLPSAAQSRVSASASPICSPLSIINQLNQLPASGCSCDVQLQSCCLLVCIFLLLVFVVYARTGCQKQYHLPGYSFHRYWSDWTPRWNVARSFVSLIWQSSWFESLYILTIEYGCSLQEFKFN